MLSEERRGGGAIARRVGHLERSARHDRVPSYRVSRSREELPLREVRVADESRYVQRHAYEHSQRPHLAEKLLHRVLGEIGLHQVLHLGDIFSAVPLRGEPRIVRHLGVAQEPPDPAPALVVARAERDVPVFAPKEPRGSAGGGGHSASSSFSRALRVGVGCELWREHGGSRLKHRDVDVLPQARDVTMADSGHRAGKGHGTRL